MMNKDRIKFENLFDIRYSPQNNDKGKALEDKVFEVFQKAVNELKNADDFRLLRNIVFKTSSYNNFEIDILLLYKESPLAIIEVKRRLDYLIGPKNKEKEQNCQQIKALAEARGIC